MKIFLTTLIAAVAASSVALAQVPERRQQGDGGNRPAPAAKQNPSVNRAAQPRRDAQPRASQQNRGPSVNRARPVQNDRARPNRPNTERSAVRNQNRDRQEATRENRNRKAQNDNRRNNANSAARQRENVRNRGDGKRNENARKRDDDRNENARNRDGDKGNENARNRNDDNRNENARNRDKDNPNRAARNERDDKGKVRNRGATGATSGEAGRDREPAVRDRDPNRITKRDDRPETAERRQRRAQAEPKLRQIRQRIDNNERVRIRNEFRRGKYRRDNFNINVNIFIGYDLPRQVRLYPVPVEIIEIAPIYRDYRYAYIDDEICIVDPETYVVVDVVGDRYRGGGSVRAEAQNVPDELYLTDYEINYIRDNVERDRDLQIDIRLSVGEDLPSQVPAGDLIEFSEELVEVVPKIREYRYVVIDNEVAIVQPDRMEVAYVIAE